MSYDETLELSKIDPPIWWINVSDAVYGPYTLGQMRSFVAEKRLTKQSLVAMGEAERFIPADQHAGLEKVFQTGAANAPVASQTEQANHVLILKSTDAGREHVIEILNMHGSFVEVLLGVFLINTETGTAKLRDELISACGEDDSLILVNANDSRLAWHGLGPDISGHIHAVWKTGN